jgi:hypothetical protein
MLIKPCGLHGNAHANLSQLRMNHAGQYRIERETAWIVRDRNGAFVAQLSFSSSGLFNERVLFPYKKITHSAGYEYEIYII